MEVVAKLDGHEGVVWAARWSPDGNLLASCGEDKTVRVWASGGGKWKAKAVLTDGHQKTVREVGWAPGGKCLASASFDGTTAIWTATGGGWECAASLEGHDSEVKAVSWADSGRLLATCSRDRSVWVWDVAEDDEFECAAVLNAHSQDVKKVAWQPGTNILASASYDNCIKMYREDPSDGEWAVCSTLRGHGSTVWALAFDKSGERLATCSDDKTVRIWRQYLPGNPQGIATPDGDPVWKCTATLGGFHEGTIYDVSWNHTNGLIATACSDNSIHIFSEDQNSDIHAPTFSLLTVDHTAHDQDVNSIAWNPTQEKVFATSSDDGLVKIWNLNMDV